MAKEKDKDRLGHTSEGLFHRIRTGEWPALKIDLSEAYANVRKRATRLRRRRIISAVLVGVLLAGVGTVLGTYYVSAIPLPNQLSLPETTTVYYSDGTTVMARLGSQHRTIISIATLPDYVGQAIVAAEDPQYWATSGTLISRQYARAATLAEGGSITGTAAQAKLAVLTWKLEDVYSKEQILEFYLNTVYFGRGAYGIEQAAMSYFGVGAARLTMAQAIVLAGVIESPGDGRFDPTVNIVGASTKFATVAQSMVSMGAIDQATARGLTLPKPQVYDPAPVAAGLAGPTGLVVAQALAEIRASTEFRDKPESYLLDGGFRIVTTIDAGAQQALEAIVDENEATSPLNGQPRNIRGAAVVVAPGTGRVLAYFGGGNGTGADYAGTRPTPDGGAAGFGYHPPAQTVSVYTLAAALQAGISAQSRWDSPPLKEFPDSGHGTADPLRDVPTTPVPCQPSCTLAEATTAGLTIPFYSVARRVGAGMVIDAARELGVGSMWSVGTAAAAPARYDLTRHAGAALVPDPFTADVALGRNPVTVLDQASAMATLAAGGQRVPTHFVTRVERDHVFFYEEPVTPARALDADVVADLTAVLAANPAGQLPDGTPSASISGTALLAGSVLDAAHAWQVGFTPWVAVAVWVGNEEVEFPLRDAVGNRITGDTLPAEIYRRIVTDMAEVLHPAPATFPAPVWLGDALAGDAAPAAPQAPR